MKGPATRDVARRRALADRLADRLAFARPLLRLAVANLRRRKAQSALLVAGIALGVAVVVAIDLANASALAAFRRSAAAVTGRATHRIVGGPTGIDARDYVRIATDPSLTAVAAAPVVEGLVEVPALGDRTLTLLGIDPLADAPFRDLLTGAAGDQARVVALSAAGGSRRGADPVSGPGMLLARSDGVLLGRALADAAGIDVGASLIVDAGGGPITATLIGILDAPDALGRRALDGLVLADIGAAQAFLGRGGRLDRIDLRLPEAPAARDAALTALAGLLPPSAVIEPAGAAADTVASMTDAFRLNLTALSLLALLVGMFLIFNTVRFNVVQRRPVLASLRALGVTRGQICALVLAEAAALGVVGAVLGVGLGLLMGRGAVALVSRTINDLYFAVDVRNVDASPASLVRGALAGLTAALLAAALPALEAARVPPVTALRRSTAEEGAHRGVRRGATAALACALAGTALLVVPSRSVALGFVALGLIVFAFALLAPAATVGTMAVLRPVLTRVLGLPGRMAPRDVVRSLSRTGVAVGALMVALSVSIGVGIMVGSFRQTVQDWLAQTLQADIFISPAAAGPGRGGRTLPPEVAERFRALPEVADVATAHPVRLRTAATDEDAAGEGAAADAEPIDVLVVGRDIAGDGRRYLSAAGDAAAVRRALDAGAVTISEPLARRLSLTTGDVLTLRSDNGPRTFPIAGVFNDYGADRGIALMLDTVYRAAWDDPRITNMAVTLRPGVDADAFTAELAGRFGRVDGTRLEFRSNRSLRAEVFQVFDRAFAITTALQVLAVVVAFIGVLAALSAVQLERARENATLRATGMTVGQVIRLALTQTGLLGLVAGVLSWPAGLTLALILIYVINRRSFGWTIQTHIDPMIFARALVLAVAAALLAGLAPAWRLVRMPIAASLREE
ncbi:MAG: ABC transporter permease [Ardenticatenales bacterium]|nr:ABC transporter permease [Ardenticatenales bacterium]